MDNRLTDEQREKIVRRSREAQSFLASSLFVEVKDWIEKEQKQTASAIAYNARTEAQKNLSRSEFVESLSGYYVSLNRIPDQLKVWANEELMIKKYDDANGQPANQG